MKTVKEFEALGAEVNIFVIEQEDEKSFLKSLVRCKKITTLKVNLVCVAHVAILEKKIFPECP